MIRNAFLLFSVIMPALLLAQSGERVFPFLGIAVSPRQAALGGDAVSVRDYDVNFAAVNPSLMNLEMHGRVSMNYGSYLAGSSYGTAAFVRDLEQGHLVSAQVRYLDYGRMARTDEFGNTLGEFSASDALAGIGYAYQFEEDWTIGGSVNFITSKIDNYTSMAVAGTGAITYSVKEWQSSISLVARNFGYQFKTYDGKRERLPLRVDLGYTQILPEFPVAITVTAHDLQKFDASSEYDVNGKKVGFGRKLADHFSIGAELFPKSGFNMRFGYNPKRGNELAVEDQRSFAGISAGFGVRIAGFRFDYAHVRYHNAANMNFFGLMLDVSGSRHY